MRITLSNLWRWDGTIGRGEYLAWGVVLFALKYNLDRILSWVWFDKGWTPYRHVHPPHLDGYLESQAGQFKLVPLDGGRTRLEGTTWYQHRLWPARYWQLWSDFIIHRIHLRVLEHVKQLSEQ